MENVSENVLERFLAFFENAIGHNRPDFHVFVDFSGHVNMVSARVYMGGWDSNKEPYEIGYCYIDHPRADWRLKQMLQSIHELSLERHKLSLEGK